ncbi:hypothetical protein CAP48_10880 [Advenella sp. S44]|uniref:ShlB/FhaC/HecB family hemolysin secretion/activation protein n=1 Tax=Advenella sp. S44 TaxID=1982755 RepID=UPI000C299A46|nr:ShlB/FhaC/HecB family hemolysin secretion/activation protein [Advenella sp. S44]PJX26477.1 hypothetical protein CAP48_10880 [Advenella sp. S44]
MSRLKTTCATGLLLLSLHGAAIAQAHPVAALVDGQRTAQQELERIRQYRQQHRNSQRHYEPARQAQQNKFKGQSCLSYDRLELVGVSLVKPDAILPSVDECLNADRLNQLSRELTALYLEHGYLHNVFVFEPIGQILYLRVTEGRVAKISGQDAIVNADMLFPGLIGKPLRIHTLDQGLDHTDKFFSNKVSVDVKLQPGGDIELQMRNQSRGRAGGYVGLDNNGNKGTGRWTARAGLVIDSPFSLSDSIMISASQSLGSKPFSLYNRSLAFHYSVPYGYWDFSVFGSISQYRDQLFIHENRYVLDGRTWQAGLRANYVFTRGSNHVSSVYGQLEQVSARGRFEKSVIYLQSPVMVSAQIGWTHLRVLPDGVMWTDVAYEQGLSWKQGYADIYKRSYRNFSLAFNAQFYHRRGQHTWHHEHELLARYSPHLLPAIKQLDLLDKYAVRGFRRMSTSAEKAVVLRNNLYLGQQQGSLTIRPYVGLDIGMQKSNRSRNEKPRWAHSWSIGLKLNAHNGLDARVEFSKGRLHDHNGSWGDHALSLNLSQRF